MTSPDNEARPDGPLRLGAFRSSTTGPAAGLDLLRLLQLARRRLRLAVLVAVGLTAAAAVGIARLPSRYAAEALVVLNDRASKLADLRSPTEGLLSRTQADLSVVKTETEILTSDATLRVVAERLDLLHDPAFSPSPDPPGMLRWWLDQARDLAGRLTGHDPGPTPPRTLDDVVASLGKAVSVINEGSSYALHLRAETRDPALSARIANAFADAYLQDQREQQGRILQAGSDWLAGRLRQLRAVVLAADEAVERYRAEHQLGQADAPSLLDTKVTQLNAALIEAGARLSRAQANLTETEAAIRRGGDLASAGSLLASPALQALRQQEADILVRKGALQQQFGPQHPQVAEIQAQLDATQNRIRLEVERIVAGMRSDVNATKGEIANLQQQLAGLEDRGAQQAEQQVRLADLERETRASRDVYVQLLQQFSTVQAQATGQQPDARLVAPARPPTESSGPDRKLLVAGAAVASAGAGLFLALALGVLRGGFGGPGPLEEATGLPVLEVLPELTRRQRRTLLAGGPLPEAANPTRALAFTLDAWTDRTAAGARVVLLTSSVAAEGKSLLAFTLGRAFATAGRRTLLVDLDPWRPALTRLTRQLPLAWDRRAVADGRLPFATDKASGLDLAVPEVAGQGDGFDTRADALRLAVEALPALRRDYDVILLDAPPVLAIPDVLLAATHADGTLLVVSFEGPRAATIRAALDRLADARANLVGTVLSRVQPRNYRRYGYGDLVYTRPRAEAAATGAAGAALVPRDGRARAEAPAP